jgi:hypothetical protein
MLWLSCNCFDYLVIALITCNCYFFNIRSSMVSKHSEPQRGRLETTTEGSLLPRAALLLLPHAVRRWEALATIAPLLFHPMTRVWRCGRCLLRHAWVTSPRPPQATTMSALTSERWAHMNTASRFQLFSIITKCIRSFFRFKG